MRSCLPVHQISLFLFASGAAAAGSRGRLVEDIGLKKKKEKNLSV